MLFENKLQSTGVAPGAVATWPVADFLLEWGARTPGTGSVSHELLRGITLVTSGKTDTYHYVPAAHILLMNSCSERLKALFAVKGKFDRSELEPYMMHLVGGAGKAKSLDELLLANARLVDRQYMQK